MRAWRRPTCEVRYDNLLTASLTRRTALANLGITGPIPVEMSSCSGSHHPAATRDGLRPGDPKVGERPVGVIEGAKHRCGYYQEGEQDHSRNDARDDGGGGEFRY